MSDQNSQQSSNVNYGAEQTAGGATQKTRLPFWRQMLSVIQASFGVQSKQNKERDFSSGSVAGFVAAALIFTAVFVLMLVFIVRLVIG